MGHARRRTPLKPQTLAAYSDAIRLLVVPELGAVRLGEVSVGMLDDILSGLDASDISTAQARSVLSQTFGLAARHGAMSSNPMSLVSPLTREAREVEVLSLDQVDALRRIVSPEVLGTPGKRRPGPDLRDVVDGLLATGCRIGELLALKWSEVDLDINEPTVRVQATLVEPRSGYVERLHRQEATKSSESRTLILPDHFVQTLTARRARTRWNDGDHPVFASRNGTYLWPNNMRTRLRAAIAPHEDLAGTTPHTLRRTVGTLIAHEVSLDAARAQLGHTAPGVTARYYVAARSKPLDLRPTLELLFQSVSDADRPAIAS